MKHVIDFMILNTIENAIAYIPQKVPRLCNEEWTNQSHTLSKEFHTVTTHSHSHYIWFILYDISCCI